MTAHRKLHLWNRLSVLLSCLVPVVLMVPLALPALDVSDVVELKKADIGEEIILEQAKAEQAKLKLKTDDLKALKAAGCSDKLIIALMTGYEPAATPAEDRPVAVTAVTPPAAAEATPPAATAEAALALEMLDATDLDVAVNAQTYTIQVARAGMLGGGVGQSWRLQGGQRQSVKVPAGSYTVQWDEDDASYPVKLSADLATKLIFSQASTKLYDAVYLSIFRGETRVDGGRLHLLKIKASAFDDSRSTPAQATPAVVRTSSEPEAAATVTPAPAVTEYRTQTVYVREPVYVSQPVYYPTPVYYTPTVRYVYPRTCTPSYVPTCRPTYRSTYYYPHTTVNAHLVAPLGHGTYGTLGVRHGGVSIGIGGRNGFIGVNLGGCR